MFFPYHPNGGVKLFKYLKTMWAQNKSRFFFPANLIFFYHPPLSYHCIQRYTWLLDRPKFVQNYRPKLVRNSLKFAPKRKNLTNLGNITDSGQSRLWCGKDPRNSTSSTDSYTNSLTCFTSSYAIHRHRLSLIYLFNWVSLIWFNSV